MRYPVFYEANRPRRCLYLRSGFYGDALIMPVIGKDALLIRPLPGTVITPAPRWSNTGATPWAYSARDPRRMRPRAQGSILLCGTTCNLFENSVSLFSYKKVNTSYQRIKGAYNTDG